MQGSMLENLHVIQGLAPVADAFSGAVFGDRVRTRDYGAILAVIVRGVGLTGTATVTVEAADNAAGDNGVAIPFRYRKVTTASEVIGAITEATASGFTIAAGGVDTHIIEIDPRDMPDGKTFVAVNTDEVVDSPVIGAILYIMGKPRFAGDTPQSVTA